MKTLIKMTQATLKEMLRDRMAMFWFIAFPVLFILLFGMIFSNEGNDQTFRVGLVAEDQGPLGTAAANALEAVPAFKLERGNLEDELDALKKGDRSLVIVLPPEGADTAQQGMEIPLYYDAGKQITNQVLIPVVNDIFTAVERQVNNRPQLFLTKPRAVQTEKFRNIDFLLPGILAMALMQLGLFGSLRLVSLKERKILKYLGATPLNRISLLGGEVIVRLLMSLLQAVILIVIGNLAFGARIVGSWLEVTGLVLLGAATFVSLGYMLVSFSKTEESAQGLIQVVQFPMMFLSGIFFPLSVMPGFLQPVIKAMPLTYLADALRQVIVGASPTYSLTTNLAILSAWLCVTLILTIRLWKWD
ncbi:MAG: ABC transporter permease [Bacillota bacterium]